MRRCRRCAARACAARQSHLPCRNLRSPESLLPSTTFHSWFRVSPLLLSFPLLGLEIFTLGNFFGQSIVFLIPETEWIAVPRRFEIQLRHLGLLPNLQRLFHVGFFWQTDRRKRPFARGVDQ